MGATRQNVTIKVEYLEAAYVTHRLHVNTYCLTTVFFTVCIPLSAAAWVSTYLYLVAFNGYVGILFNHIVLSVTILVTCVMLAASLLDAEAPVGSPVTLLKPITKSPSPAVST